MIDPEEKDKLYLMHISPHGLIRSKNLELGRDSDTGGQTTYVVELVRALAAHPAVAQVDLLTRRIEASGVDSDYANAREQICDGARLVRIVCGPRRYLRKERLWPYLDNFVDNTIHYIRKSGRVPDAIHAHYADAGYIGAQLARMLGVPFFFTGHSLGRVKQRRMLEKGASRESIEKRFNFSQRIEAEETALDTATQVIVSTRQEIDQQYELYDCYQPKRMVVIPPGVDLSRFSPPDMPSRGTAASGSASSVPLGSGEAKSEYKILGELKRFLQHPEKPMILAIARPDERKNFPALVEAYGESAELRALANLVLVAGNREELTSLNPGARRVLRNLMTMIDHYDLYGLVAYPKRHTPSDIPDLYKIASERRGVFVNPALTEPFGLTLIEAAASGLPIVATDDGGPRDIIATCDNGLLVDPLQPKQIAKALLDVLSDSAKWDQRRANGIRGALEEYSWQAHVTKYLQYVSKAVDSVKSKSNSLFTASGTRLPAIDRLLLTNLEDTLTGDAEATAELFAQLTRAACYVGFGLTSGRPLEQVLETLRKYNIPVPDLLITSAGTEIHYGKMLVQDKAWKKHIIFRWDRDAVRKAMEEFPGVTMQPETEQAPFKVCYEATSENAPGKKEIAKHLRSRDIRANIVISNRRLIDILPIRASTGHAIRHLMMKWDLQPENLLTVGTSGHEEAMLSGNTLGVVVGHYSSEIKQLMGRPRIFFSTKPYAWGVLEGIAQYDFFGTMSVPSVQEEPNFTTTQAGQP